MGWAIVFEPWFCWSRVGARGETGGVREWTTERIRKEVSWRAFKEGQRLVESGGVPGFGERNGILTGVFMQGKRRLRTVVRTAGVLEVDCQCAENRSSGAVCKHAVALLLAAADPDRVPKASPKRPEPAAEVRGRASVVRFPPQWPRALAAGSLAVRIQWVEDEPDDGDLALCRWWAEVGKAGQEPGQLHLSGEVLGNLLAALSFHSRIEGPEGPIEAGDLLPARLMDSRRTAQGLELVWRPDGRVWISLPDFAGWAEPRGFSRTSGEALAAETEGRIRDFVELGRVVVPEGALAQELQFWLDLTSEPRPGWLAGVRTIARPPRIRIDLEGSMNALDAQIRVEPPDPGEEGVVVVEAEGHREQLLAALRENGFAQRGGDLWVIRDTAAATDFLANRLDGWKQRWELRIGPQLSHVLKSLHVIRPVIEPTGGGSLAVEISYQTGAGKPVPRAKVLELIRSGRTSNRTKSGAQVVVAREVFEDFEPLAADLGIAGPEGRLQLTPAQLLGLRSFRENSDKLRLSRDSDIRVTELNGFALRDYQSEGVSWLVDRLLSLGGALLADEMGLGKTVQTIAAIRRLKESDEKWRALVVVPSSLLANWEAELERFAPDLQVVRLHGADRDARREKPADVVLTSYGTLVRDLAFHLRAEYALMVLDEAGAIRNPASQTSKSVAKIPARGRLALSGTPVENRLLDLWSIFRVVAPGHLGSKDEFSARYGEGGGAEAKRLSARIAPFVLRRTKAEVAKDLPEKSISDVVLELGEDDRRIYQEIALAGLTGMESMKDGSAARMHLLTVLLRLRQLCLSPKLLNDEWGRGGKTEWLSDFLRERAERRKKTLVFSQFAVFLRNEEKSLGDEHGAVFRLDGSTTDRGERVKRFQQHAGPAVFLISLKAGGYGLNLTAADAVVHMDPWWNPAAESQANDRAHRIGQALPVTVYRLLMRDTVEQRVRRLQDAKRALIEGLNGGETASGWSDEELVGLLR
ncbi:DEAD/DEAH box helicase [Haloferula sargassicola]|uniref:RNA polymerase-associated protein RapA n=1 Tax=Haloferula sargassicola TaxID=490096 RepID=A0ABP9UQB0_9BACT